MISYEPLRTLLSYRNISYQQLLDEGYSTVTLAKINKDEAFSLDTIHRLCQFLKVPIERIVRITDENGLEFEKEDYYEADRLLKKYEELKLEKDELEVAYKKSIDLQSELQKQLRVQQIDIVDEEDEISTLADRVKRKRQEKGLSVKELAQLVKMTPVTLYKIEDGETVNPTINALISMCEVFHCSLEWLVYGKKSK